MQPEYGKLASTAKSRMLMDAAAYKRTTKGKTIGNTFIDSLAQADEAQALKLATERFSKPDMIKRFDDAAKDYVRNKTKQNFERLIKDLIDTARSDPAQLDGRAAAADNRICDPIEGTRARTTEPVESGKRVTAPAEELSAQAWADKVVFGDAHLSNVPEQLGRRFRALSVPN